MLEALWEVHGVGMEEDYIRWVDPVPYSKFPGGNGGGFLCHTYTLPSLPDPELLQPLDLPPPPPLDVDELELPPPPPPGFGPEEPSGVPASYLAKGT